MRLAASLLLATCPCACADLERMKYNHPGLEVDLGVGLWAWPLPMDFDGDGDLDLVVNCPDKPHNGTYFFENASGDTAGNPLPVFKPAVRISKGIQNVQISYPGGRPVVTSPAATYPDFVKTGLENPAPIAGLPANIHPNKVRANHWRIADYDGDGRNDLVIGVEDWTEYGWDNAYDANGRWMNGPLRGYVYLARNTGTNESPAYQPAVKIMTGDRPLETYGAPSPSLADMDGDGDLDLVCGEFLDGFTYFRNTGTRTAPVYERGRRLRDTAGAYLAMHVQMITPVVVDWDKDGRPDMICGDEDGRVAFIRNAAPDGGIPVFEKPVYFRQQADEVKFGALATPVGCDWDGDGDHDLISGNTAGNIAFIENLSGPGVERPKWAAPVLLEADGRVIRILAGPNGSIQGPAEAKWGYTTLCVADWDGDGLQDLLVNTIWGKVVWHRNTGTRKAPALAAAQPIEVEWDGPQPSPSYGWLRPEGKALLTQWRTTPNAVDWNKDGLTDLVMLDQEGYLAFFKRAKRGGKMILLPPERALFSEARADGEPAPKYFQAAPMAPIRMNNQSAGKSGRRKICITDWDGDGRLDLLVNAANASFVRQTRAGKNSQWFFKDEGLISPRNIEGHDVSPTVVDFNGNGIPDFIGGAEDGFFYYLKNPRTK